MKKIITLLFFVGLLGSAFAQDGKRDHNGNNQYQPSGYSKDHNYGSSKSYPGNDGYNDNRQWNNRDNEKGYGRNGKDYGDRDHRAYKDRDDRGYRRQSQNHYPKYDNRKTQKPSWLGIVLNVVLR
jgi:hypothetical protein